MQFFISKKQLLKTLSIANGVAPKKSTSDILTHILITAQTNDETNNSTAKITIRATDETLSYSDTILEGISNQVKSAGGCAVNANDLFTVVKNLPDGEIEISHQTENGELTIRTKKIEFKLNTIAQDQFPNWTATQPDRLFQYPAKTFLDLVDRVLFSAGTDGMRQYLCGVHFVVVDSQKDKDSVGKNGKTSDGKKLRAVSTDGHRLSLAETDAQSLVESVLAEGKMAGQTFPTGLLVEVRKMLGNASDEDTFFVGFSDRKVFFQYGEQTLFGLILEGSYPDYTQVIPDASERETTVNRTELLDALRRIALLSPEKSGGVRFKINGSLHLSSQHTGRGKAEQEIKILDGENPDKPVEIGFNAHYFVEALSTIETEWVTVETKNAQSPALLKARTSLSSLSSDNMDGAETAENTDQTEKNTIEAKYVIMPMRL